MKYVRSAAGTALVIAGAAVPACTYGGGRDTSNGIGTVVPQRDSLIAGNARLSALVRTVDRVGRRTTSLPATLEEIRDEPGVSLVDPWGRNFTYSPSGRDFSIRSAGRDGVFGTGDDMVARGRLGRALPCELRDEQQTARFERVAPPCDEARVEVVYPVCPVLERADRIEHAVPETLRDSVLFVGRRLVRVARAIDGYGREIGMLPQTLRGPVIWSRTENGGLLDAWAREVRYHLSNDRFELRSSGPDGVYDSDDDIVVRATLGTNIPCQFRTEWGDEQCAEPPPTCLGSGNQAG